MIVDDYIHIDLFSGIGGFSKGLKEAGFPTSKTYFSEIDKYAISVYRRNFPDAEYIGGVESISGSRFKGRKGGISKSKTPTLDHNCYLGINEKQNIRRLSPIECERLQGFPEIKKCVMIEVWKENQKKNASVERQNLKLLKRAGSAEKKDSQENVLYAVRYLSIKDQQIKKRVQKNVLINLGESRVEILSQGRSLLNVNFVDAQRKLALHTKIENIALLIVSINTILEKITQTGKVEFHQNEQSLTDQKNGNYCVTKSGREIMQLVKNVKKDSTILNHYFKSITSNPLSIKNIDLMSKILFYFASLVMKKYIKKENKTSILLTHSFGWTKYGHYNQLISDSQRYKMLGNAVSVPVVKCIGERLINA